MKKQDIKAIKELLATPKTISIIPHRGPDGDAMGSTLALYHFLKKFNHDVTVIAPNEFPGFLSWLPGADTVKIFEKEKDKCSYILNNSNIIFTLDFNALHRVGHEMEVVLAAQKATFIMIDHHQKPDDYAKYVYSDTNFGSTCEMVYNFITYLDHNQTIDTTIGTCIYTGILTDSGSFKFTGTTGNTHRIVASLIELGVQNTKIPTLLFENNSYNRLQLLGRALQNMTIIAKHRASYTSLSQEELDTFNFVKGDTEGIVNYGLSIKGIQIAAIFIENKEEKIIKISFRSQGDIDVNQFARDHFNGGGHINAAGGKSEDTMEATILKFEKLVTQF